MQVWGSECVWLYAECGMFSWVPNPDWCLVLTTSSRELQEGNKICPIGISLCVHSHLGWEEHQWAKAGLSSTKDLLFLKPQASWCTRCSTRSPTGLLDSSSVLSGTTNYGIPTCTRCETTSASTTQDSVDIVSCPPAPMFFYSRAQTLCPRSFLAERLLHSNIKSFRQRTKLDQAALKVQVYWTKHSQVASGEEEEPGGRTPWPSLK